MNVCTFDNRPAQKHVFWNEEVIQKLVLARCLVSVGKKRVNRNPDMGAINRTPVFNQVATTII